MNSLRILTVGAVLVAAAVATAAEERIETIVVTAKPARVSAPAVEKVAPPAEINVSAPMPTDMPEAEIDYHMPLIAVAHSDRTAS